METPTSFKVDHLTLEPGIYLRDADHKRGVFTYDIRLVKPTLSQKKALSPQISHTIEHSFATYLRTISPIRDEVVYIGPMGCLTGFYLLTYINYNKDYIREIVIKALEYIRTLEEVPGAKPSECGNYTLFDLPGTKGRIYEFITLLKKDNNQD